MVADGETVREEWPPIKPDTQVKTTQPNSDMLNGWSKEALLERRWDVSGVVFSHHDSHGLCYGVRHDDGSTGYYDPSELEITRELSST